jgi:hypothetical protein
MVRRLLVFIAVAVVAGGSAKLGAWWVPFIIGVVAGGLPRASRAAWAASSRLGFPSVPFAVLAAVLGWAVPLWAMSLAGLPAGATARAIAGLAGLPPYAAVTIVATLLLAALQVLAGAWLARAVLGRRYTPA